MDTLRGYNSWKATGILLLFALFIGIMLFGPGLRAPPVTEPVVDVPAVSNVPAPSSPGVGTK